MKQPHLIANGILWASAILASALVGAPTFLTAVLLPGLAATSLVLGGSKARATGCRG